jgi:hypothetical protein
MHASASAVSLDLAASGGKKAAAGDFRNAVWVASGETERELRVFAAKLVLTP